MHTSTCTHTTKLTSTAVGVITINVAIPISVWESHQREASLSPKDETQGVDCDLATRGVFPLCIQCKAAE